MLKFLDSHDDCNEWDKIVKNTDPHFSSAYYRAFGGGQLAVFNEGELTQPFRFQENGWIGNVYNFGGLLGPPEEFRRYAEAFDKWKISQSFSERCTVSPHIAQSWHRIVSTKDVVFVCLDEPNTFRQTTKNCIEKAKKAGAVTSRVEPDQENAFLFEMLYEKSMSLKKAAPHWRYPHSRFHNILTELGPAGSALFFTRIKNKLLCACLLIFDDTNCYYHWAARVEERDDSGVSHYQVASTIEWSRQQKHKTFLLGGGFSPNDGLYIFKQGFSRKAMPCQSYITNPNSLALE